MAQNTPVVSRELVEWLESIFPNRIPDSPDEYNTYLTRVGEQRVIRRLRGEMTKQSRNLLESR